MRRFLRWLGGGIYPALSLRSRPEARRAAEQHFERLWRQAPPVVALVHTLIALAICLLPPFLLGRFRPFSSLAPADQDRMVRRMLGSRLFLLRLLAYAARGQAMVAVLKDPEVRRAVLPAEIEVHSAPSAPTPIQAAPAEADFVVIGSGAAGATAALVLAGAGRDTVVLEEGGWYHQPDFTEDLYGAMARLFRDFGNQVARGRSVFPVLEGCCVGGSTVINGGIIHRLPRRVFEEWNLDIRFEEIERCAVKIEAALGVRANLAPQLPALPIARVLRELGWRHQAMLRNAPGCQASGRCLQGCPSGGKLSMEASFIPRAVESGARVCARHRAQSVVFDGRRAIGVLVDTPEGRRLVRARRAVVMAAGAIRTPLLLGDSGITNPHCGRHLQVHLGVGSTAELPQPVRTLEGPPQGIEVLEFDDAGIKLATQLLPPELRLVRTPAVGDELEALLKRCDHLSSWTGSVRSDAEGTVSGHPGHPAHIRFEPSRNDLERLRTSLKLMAQLQAALGATAIFPGVTVPMRDPAAIEGLPLDARAYWISVGHIFGTCRIGVRAATGVVSPELRVHGTDNLFVVDASVFPTNIGVNPQLAIMSLAMLAAERFAKL